MPTLREMTAEYRELLDAVENEDGAEVVVPATGEVVEGDDFLSRLYALEGDLERKVDGICSVVKELEAAQETMRQIEGRYSARRRSFDRRVEWLRRYLAEQMTAARREKVKTLHFTAYFGGAPDRLVIDHEHLVPEEFRKPPSPPPVDGPKLKKWLKESGEDGWLIVQGPSGPTTVARLEKGARPLVIRA